MINHKNITIMKEGVMSQVHCTERLLRL